MLAKRVIPCLLLHDGGFYKTVRFKSPVYVGDPINAVKIFNEKEVDEIIVLDYRASVDGYDPPVHMIEQIASQCFMPLCYGGGIRRIEQIRMILNAGVEKIAINSIAMENPEFVQEASVTFGCSTIVVSIDVRRSILGKHEVQCRSGTMQTGRAPVETAIEMARLGAGELMINSIDRDGTRRGYDIDLVRCVAEAVDIPIIACGGAGGISDLKEVIHAGSASAAAAGSLFIFHGVHQAVLINYPSRAELSFLDT